MMIKISNLATAVIVLSPLTSPAEGFLEWAASHSKPGILENNDDDGDGIPALVEYVTGLSPNLDECVGEPTQVSALQRISFPKSSNSTDAGITLGFETSTTLNSWQPVSPTSESSSAITLDLTNIPRGFARLKVSLAEELLPRLNSAVSFAEAQMLDLASDTLDDDREKFVNYTSSNGQWRTATNERTWTSGFVPGCFWYLYDYTGSLSWRSKAEHWTEGCRSRATATDNDTGFQVFDSFGIGWSVVEDSPSEAAFRSDYLDVMLEAADTLVDERYRSAIGCFRSWPQNEDNPHYIEYDSSEPDNDQPKPFEVIIDQLMNVELILFAAANGGPSVYEDYVINHADTTWEHGVRSDGSTYHVVAYERDGEVRYRRSHQGWQTDSTWSRGQSWAVYAYAMIYRYTGLPRMLERSEKCFDFFMAEARKDDANTLIPFSDFDAPIDNDNPRDTSAAAVVASAAIELYEITGKTKYLEAARGLLYSLTTNEFLAEETNSYESILLKASEKWGEDEVGCIFGDYFFLEAANRYRKLVGP